MKATYIIDITSCEELRYECDSIKVDFIIDELLAYDLEDEFMQYLENTYKNEIPTIEELTDYISYVGKSWIAENKPKDDTWGDYYE